MKTAEFWEKVSENDVKCGLCSHRCVIADSVRGVCGVRENRGGKLFSLVYGKAIAASADPIEKKPLYHFLPGTLSFSVATIGCNFRCLNCQNADISQLRKAGEVSGRDLSPEEVVEQALDYGCKSISYTYTEPTIFYEYACDIGILARKRGLKNNFVTNGYMTSEVIEDASSFLDAANVDLKAFSEEFYQRVCGARLAPVLDSLKLLKEKGVWVEVTTLIIPTLNDSGDELSAIASFICDELGADTPWHVSRFHPDHRLTDLERTPMETIKLAIEVGGEAGLRHIYAGNVPHDETENTCCPNCRELLVERVGFGVEKNSLTNGTCPSCKEKIAGVWN
ncbi:MAG: AmmeMemoRadiSam system radical SAM enzyme [Candidatus Altiarchaeota archaeon]